MDACGGWFRVVRYFKKRLSVLQFFEQLFARHRFGVFVVGLGFSTVFGALHRIEQVRKEGGSFGARLLPATVETGATRA